MRRATVASLLAVAAIIGTVPLAAAPARRGTPSATAALRAAIADPQRGAENRARDRYRHPAETLAFFGVKPGDTIVEFSPGGGWYTEILAPLVKGNGHYIALVGAKDVEKTTQALVAKQGWYGATTVAGVDPTTGATTIAPGSADVLLTFRNVHNLLMNPDQTLAAKVFAGCFAALKPGGTLGIVDHRLPEDRDAALERSSGYLKRSTILRLAAAAGFRLVAESRVNANPKDDHDHPRGVWTLPPTYSLKDQDRATYAAIGESDRMTLRFVKPR